MNTIFLHIFSNFPSKLTFYENNKQIFSICSNQIIGNELNLKIENFKSFKINVYPFSKDFLPYSLTFAENNNKLFLSNDFASLFSLPECNYVLLLKQITIANDCFLGDKIEIADSMLNKLTCLNDLRGRGKVESFSISKNNLVKKDEYFVSLNKSSQNLANDLILLDFFQSIFAKDFSTAKQNLSTSFASVLTKETIKSFFGDFSSCKIVNYFPDPAIALFYSNQIKIFSARIVDNKICDIYQIN